MRPIYHSKISGDCCTVRLSKREVGIIQTESKEFNCVHCCILLKALYTCVYSFCRQHKGKRTQLSCSGTWLRFIGINGNEIFHQQYETRHFFLFLTDTIAASENVFGSPYVFSIDFLRSNMCFVEGRGRFHVTTECLGFVGMCGICGRCMHFWYQFTIT